ncbi:hypothetical protein [Bordetella bronchialis]|uniref:Uncharacterized protein n=1 Tax=Bordetella bronchialis TaxID=463025 RepID=A0A193FHD6_9BORD|nr:hypothetical protein [Bordetella bronchialis]ANN67075.1 hypothetical protein BAU06_12930 [Bordetella bronchialis]ANN72152.1 hypothetical protein BAU08_13125 [Bordetella bronchialis]
MSSHDAQRIPALLRAALWSGSVASLASVAVLAYAGRRERASALAPVNAPSHWLWRDEALHEQGFTLRHTLPGYLIHHGSSVFWAVFFEHLLLDRPHNAARAAALAAAVAGVAAGVDLKLTPKRLTPGFERQLRPRALVAMYSVFGAALYAAHVLRRRWPARMREGGKGAIVRHAIDKEMRESP